MAGKPDRKDNKDAAKVGGKDTAGERETRLAQAMRLNLKRRKHQARARQDEAADRDDPERDHDDG